jgi:ribonuclease R
VRVTLNRRGRDRFTGTISAVLERKRKTLRGFVHVEHGETWVLPLNEKLPMIFVPPEERQAGGEPDSVVEVEIVSYPRDADTAPTGRILRVIENAGSPDQIVASILDDLQIPTAFSRQTEREVARIGREPRVSGARGREDLTELPFVTIDGEDARDFDDAVCLSTLPDGSRRLQVAIADVAQFVKADTALDGEAYARGTSVYFPRGVVPMLPELLSNDLCSLRPGEPRLTLTCEMDLDAGGKRKAYRLFESVIQSKARLTYHEVQQFLETKRARQLGRAARLAGMIAEMGELALLLARKRRERGALGFEFPEARFTFAKGERPERVEKAFPTEATRLIEQFMLEANEAVAWHCATEKIPILYRVHDPPPPDQLTTLRLQLQTFGLEVREGELADPRGINRLLGRIRNHPGHEELELNVLRALTQAQYRSANDGHFALNATHYTHFTSPIRRFPDLLVHRALKRTLRSGRKASAAPVALPEEAGAHLSTRERTAGEAENRVRRLYKVLYMEPFLGESFPAQVTGLSAKGLWVSLRDHFAEGFVPLSLLPDDHYRFDAQRNVLRGRRRRREIRFGEQLTVQLARAERMTQELEFAFNAWGWQEDEGQEGPQDLKSSSPGRSGRKGR